MEQENNTQLTQITEKLQEIVTTLNKDPKAERYHSETHCPSCGRFVGTETRCPYCQTETQKRLSIRIFKVISVLISTLGLIMLLFYARGVETEKVKISDLGPLTNFAHVRIVGYASNDANISKWGTLSFTIYQFYDKDGKIVTDRTMFKDCRKEEIRVTAYKKVVENINTDNLPRIGEEVDVEGQVRVQQGVASLLINAPEHIRTIYNEKVARRKLGNKNHTDYSKPVIIGAKRTPPIPADKITPKMLSRKVKVLGKVKSAELVENDCVIIKLENGKPNGLPVFIPAFSKKKISMPVAASMIEVYGTVENYNDELEITVKKGYEYVKVLPQK